MIIKLTDAKRYELERDNVLAVLLDAERRGEDMTEKTLQFTLGIDDATLTKLITKLETDGFITTK